MSERTMATELRTLPPSRPQSTPPSRLPDLVFRGACYTAALLVIAQLAALIVCLVLGAWPALERFGFGFLISQEWSPLEDRFGALTFVYGTVVTSAIAMLIATPLGVGTATFLSEIANGWVRRIGAFLVELLVAIPSVVYGFWGYYFLVPIVRTVFRWLDPTVKSISEIPGLAWFYVDNPDGFGLVSAGLVLAIMVVPYITAITFDVCQAVPRSQREGSLALGATRWQMIWTAVLPYARPGIVGGCFLALGRALGETMAVLMLIGANYQRVELSIFGKGATIASVIADSYGESSDPLKRAVLVNLGLVLLLVTIVINCLARFLLWQVQSQRPGRTWLSWLRRSAGSTAAASVNGEPVTGQSPVELPARQRLVELTARQNRVMAWINWLMTGVLASCLLITLGPLFLILGDITYRGVTSLNLAFFTNLPLDEPAGLAHALAGSAMMVGLATLIAVPIGLLAAIFLVEYRASRLAGPVRFIGELLGGVPSIVIGIFAYAVIGSLTGPSGWAGAFALAVMMIPIVMRSSEESLKLVPQSLRNASYALGAAHWQTVLRVTVPAALSAIITGVFLAVARIAGETAPLLLTADATTDWNLTLNGPTPYLTYYIFHWSKDVSVEHNQVAWAGAFVLLTLVMLLNIGVRLATGKRLVSAARAD